MDAVERKKQKTPSLPDLWPAIYFLDPVRRAKLAKHGYLPAVDKRR
jgi:hypothetical protein